MKSLTGSYQASGSNTSETFADLIFCALVVLVLFVLALAVEVSQRIRAKAVPAEEVKAEEVLAMTPAEIEALSAKMRDQKQKIIELQARVEQGQQEVSDQMAALSGEQRFTGAREPASVAIAYNYVTEKYHLIPAKLIRHADTRTSGEGASAYLVRKKTELIDIATKALESRRYSLEEMKSIYNSISQYNEIVERGGRHQLKQEKLGINYHILLCEYISGEFNAPSSRELIVVDAIMKVYDNPGKKHDGMYPTMTCTVDSDKESVTVGGVRLSASDLRILLISISGRGVTLDFEGYEGKAPKWLYDKALMPSGYVSKTPKLPKL